jgi:hypothetical protein
MAPLDPPPELIYQSHEEGFDAVSNWAEVHGFSVRNRRTTTNRKGELRMRNICCTKFGICKSKAHIPKGGTQRTNCLFDCRLYSREAGTFELKVINPSHNHEPYEDVLGDTFTGYHSTLRRRDPEIMAKIAHMRKANVSPRIMLTTLHLEFPGCKITTKDIYNEILKLRKEQLAGLSPIEALLSTLQEDSNWHVEYEVNDESTLTHLFFAYRPGTKLYHAFPDLLLLDCTYKTNRYKMPLLHFLGITPLNKHFSAAFCFLPGEIEADYTWAVQCFVESTLKDEKPGVLLTDNESALKNALTILLPDVPQLLCVWHVNKNLLTQVQGTWHNDGEDTGEEREEKEISRRDFMKAWYRAVHSKTEDEFETKYSELKSLYASQPTLCDYLDQYQYPQRQEVAFP